MEALLIAGCFVLAASLWAWWMLSNDATQDEIEDVDRWAEHDNHGHE